jgi:hypothetical protein
MNHTYVATPLTIDTATLLREERIRTRHLRTLLRQADAEIEAREGVIQALLLGE